MLGVRKIIVGHGSSKARVVRNVVRTVKDISEYGNTSSASIPIALNECVEAGSVFEGNVVLLTSFSGVLLPKFMLAENVYTG